MSLEWITSVLTFLLGIGLGILVQRYWLDKTSRAARLENELTGTRHAYLDLKSRIESHRDQSLDLIRDFQLQSKRMADHFENLVVDPLPALPHSKEKGNVVEKAPLEHEV